MSTSPVPLSRREREIMEVLFRRKEATAVQVAEGLADPPSNSAIRTHLRILEEKGHIRHRQDKLTYVFIPIEAPEKASRSALTQVVRTFFEGSLTKAVAALVDNDAESLSKADLNHLESIIKAAKSKAR